MSETTSTYQDILSQLEKLQLENKRLRLRPSLNSADSNILEFMNIKSELARATLAATSLESAMTICVKHLQKIINIHSVSFFTHKLYQNNIEMVSQKGLPKKILKDITNQDFFNIYKPFLFPEKCTVYFSKDLIENEDTLHSSILSNLRKFKTLFVLPVLQSNDYNVSVLLLSQKPFADDRYAQILYQSIHAQLNSSFTRVIMTEKLETQKHDLKESIKTRTLSFENMNKELMQQIQIHRQKEQRNSEELNLFKSIILQQKDIVLRINKEGQILYSNPQFQYVKMINKGLSGNLVNYFGNGDFPGLDFINWDFEREIQRVTCEIQLFIPNEEWFSFNFTPIRNKRGLLTEIQVVARNVNRIKKLENKLRYQKEMLLNMLNTSEKIRFTINKEQRVEFISDNWEIYSGHSSTKTINHRLIDFAHQDEIGFINSKLAPLYSSEVENCNFTCKIQYADKTWHSQKVEIFSILSTNGNVKYYVGSLLPLD